MSKEARFDSSPLHWLGCLSLLITPMAGLLIGGLVYRQWGIALDYPLATAWVVLGCVALYFGHILFTRLDPAVSGLLAATALVLISTSLVLWISGWQAALTTGLALTAWLVHAGVGAGAASRLLPADTRPSAAGAFVVFLLGDAALALALAGGFAIFASLFPERGLTPIRLGGFAAVAVAILLAVPALRLTRHARRRARELSSR